MLLNTPSGVIDLETGEVLPHDPKFRITQITSASLGRECPRWITFLEEVTDGDAELIAYLARLAGYCLTGSTREQMFAFLHGDGANGKSVFLSVLAKVLGDYAATSTLDTFMASRAARHLTELAGLKGLLYGPDGAAFSPTHTRKGGKLYRYYVSQTVLKHGAGSCTIGRVPAGEIEAAVIDQFRAVFRQPEIVAGTWKAVRAKDSEITEADARTALQQLDPLWDELFPAEQARIMALLIERIDIGTDGLNVRLRVDGLSGLAREMLTNHIDNAA